MFVKPNIINETFVINDDDGILHLDLHPLSPLTME